MKIVFRAEGDAATGAGHALRCLALADTIKALEPEAQIAFAAREETYLALPRLARFTRIDPEPCACDLVVVDGYGFDQTVEAAWAAKGARVAAMEDQPGRRHRCDILLDSAPNRRPQDYAGLIPTGTLLLLGLRFAVTSPHLKTRRQEALSGRRRPQGVRRILISTGLGDVGGGAISALEALKNISFINRIDVAVGSGAASRPALMRLAAADPRVKLQFDSEAMDELMAVADLAIGAAGGSAWERCVLGLPSVVLVAADNQSDNAAALAQAGAATVLGKAGEVPPAAIAAEVERLQTDVASRRAMAKAASELVDGRGAERVARVLLRGL